jgi:quinol-cytochrome oxidoreductase complex cytochrome b subunit
VTNDWSFVWTPQFLLGTVIAGLLLNIVAAYVVRAVDHVRKALPASYRRARGEESARIEQLASAATSDNALYAALAAEASRLRLHQLLHFFIAFVCVHTFLFLMAVGELKPGVGVLGLLLIVFLIGLGFIQYCLGLDMGTRARRLDLALREVQRNRKLPVMD